MKWKKSVSGECATKMYRIALSCICLHNLLNKGSLISIASLNEAVNGIVNNKACEAKRSLFITQLNNESKRGY